MTETDNTGTPGTPTPGTPSPGVLFVCVRNGGKPQMAAGLMRRELEASGSADRLRVSSAGTHPGTSINTLSAEVLQEVGADISGETPVGASDPRRCSTPPPGMRFCATRPGTIEPATLDEFQGVYRHHRGLNVGD